MKSSMAQAFVKAIEKERNTKHGVPSMVANAAHKMSREEKRIATHQKKKQEERKSKP